MSALATLFSGLILIFSAFAEGMPEEGMSPAQVRALLGEPQGSMEMGASIWWVFERGNVRFRDGKLVEHTIIDEETARIRQEEQAVARVRNREEGEALKAARLADVSFLALPASERLRFWTAFQRSYPDVDVFTPLAQARAEVNAQEEARRERERLAMLESRVRDAELQARRAEEQARDAMWFNRRTIQPQVIVWPTVVQQPPRRVYPEHRSGLNISYERNGLNVQFQTPARDPWIQPWGSSLYHLETLQNNQGSGFIHGRSHGVSRDRIGW